MRSASISRVARIRSEASSSDCLTASIRNSESRASGCIASNPATLACIAAKNLPFDNPYAKEQEEPKSKCFCHPRMACPSNVERLVPKELQAIKSGKDR